MAEKPKGATDKPLEIITDNPVPVSEFKINTHLTKMQKRYAEQDAICCRPSGWIAPAGIPNPKFESKREKEWEYVVGVVEAKEGITSLGELEMDWCGWPGDPITTWKIPTSKIVALPYGIAKSIQDGCKYSVFKVDERDVLKRDNHGEYLTSWRREEIKQTATFRKVNDL